MRRRIMVFLLFTLVTVGLIPSRLGLAQSTDEASQLRALVAKNESEINKWEGTANIMIVLTILVGILGIAAGGLQKSQANWCRLTTILVGLCVSAITLILNTAFPTDYRQLRRQASEGRELVADLDLMISSGIPVDEQSHRVWLETFQKNLHQLIRLGRQPEKMQAMWDIVPKVYAQSAGRKPSWITTVPDDSVSLYFLGVGDDPSLEKAREVSKENATRRSVEYLSQQFQVAQGTKQEVLDSSELSRYVVKSAEEAGVYFEYVVTERSYRYYTLLRIPKNLLDADLRLYGLQTKTQIPSNVSAVAQTAPNLSRAYSATPYPYLLGETEIQRSHVRLLSLATGRMGIYVADLPESPTVRFVVFQGDHASDLREQQALSYAQLKKRLREDEIIVDQEVVPPIAIRMRLGQRQVLFELDYKRALSGPNYAFLAIKSAQK